jgi:hypothetical protein
MPDPNTPEATTAPTPIPPPGAPINPFTPPEEPPASTIAPPAPLPPAEPEKPKTAYVVIEPEKILEVDDTPSEPTVAPKGKPTVPDKAQIVATGALTVVMVKTTGTPSVKRFNAVKLPKGAADLSVVEVHRDPTSTGPDVAVFPNKDESIGTLPVNDGKNSGACAVGVSSSKPVSFRKMSKALWAVIS